MTTKHVQGRRPTHQQIRANDRPALAALGGIGRRHTAVDTPTRAPASATNSTASAAAAAPLQPHLRCRPTPRPRPRSRFPDPDPRLLANPNHLCHRLTSVKAHTPLATRVSRANTKPPGPPPTPSRSSASASAPCSAGPPPRFGWTSTAPGRD